MEEFYYVRVFDERVLQPKSSLMKEFFDGRVLRWKSSSTKEFFNGRVFHWKSDNWVYPQFLQPFSIDSADFPCRDPAISSPHSCYGQNICSVLDCPNIFTYCISMHLYFIIFPYWTEYARKGKWSSGAVVAIKL
jgi:hypothetical protein